MEYQAALVAAHVVSGIVGATCAYASGIVHMLRRKDEASERSASRFSAFGSAMAGGGLAVLALTGILLVALDPARHLDSPAFQAKMTMVAVLVASASVSRFARTSHAVFLARAAVTAVTWAGAIALGLRAGAGASYGEIMIVYAAVLVAAVIASIVFRASGHARYYERGAAADASKLKLCTQARSRHGRL